jgi:hypothetical protein
MVCAVWLQWNWIWSQQQVDNGKSPNSWNVDNTLLNDCCFSEEILGKMEAILKWEDNVSKFIGEVVQHVRESVDRQGERWGEERKDEKIMTINSTTSMTWKIHCKAQITKIDIRRSRKSKYPYIHQEIIKKHIPVYILYICVHFKVFYCYL